MPASGRGIGIAIGHAAATLTAAETAPDWTRSRSAELNAAAAAAAAAAAGIAAVGGTAAAETGAAAATAAAEAGSSIGRGPQ